MKYPFQIWVNHGYETHIYFHLYSDPGYLVYYKYKICLLKKNKKKKRIILMQTLLSVFNLQFQ